MKQEKDHMTLRSLGPVEDQLVKVDLTNGTEKNVADIGKEITQKIQEHKNEIVKTHTEQKTEFNNELILQNDLLKLIKDNLTNGTDYMKIPGTQSDSLLQGGANKIALWAKIRIDLKLIDKLIDVNNKIVYYKYEAIAYQKDTEKKLGSAFASCNSQEKKFKRQSDANIFDTMNTIDQMAQKRAYVRAVRTTCGLTGLFTQDLDESKYADKADISDIFDLANRIAMNDKYIDEYAKNNASKKGTKKERSSMAIRQAKKAGNITQHSYKKWSDDDAKTILKELQNIWDKVAK